MPTPPGPPSPLWLTVFGETWSGDPAPAKKVLCAYEAANPGCVHADYRGYATVMLRVPIGVERTQLIATLRDQVHAIGEVIAPLGVGAKDSPPPENAVADP